LNDGRSTNSLALTLPPIAFELVSTSGDSPVTVTDSSMPPTSSRISICVDRPTPSSTPLVWYFLNPDSSAVTS
jgi:hypothetical protein